MGDIPREAGKRGKHRTIDQEGIELLLGSQRQKKLDNNWSGGQGTGEVDRKGGLEQRGRKCGSGRKVSSEGEKPNNQICTVTGNLCAGEALS